ncbi:MAG: hypothetical protein ACE5JR_06285 [Gemmatimonadota bacterium]
MKRTNLLGAVAASAASLALATPALAQDRPMFELPAIEVRSLEKELHRQAIALYETPSRWKEAAKLHKQAAESLPKNDAGRYWGYDRAARLFYYAGDFPAARKSMERAARVAVATGDVLTAAHAYVDAAFVAVSEGYGGKMREFVREARELSNSELLTAYEQSGILGRIEGTRGGPVAARSALVRRFGTPRSLAAGSKPALLEAAQPAPDFARPEASEFSTVWLRSASGAAACTEAGRQEAGGAPCARRIEPPWTPVSGARGTSGSPAVRPPEPTRRSVYGSSV